MTETTEKTTSNHEEAREHFKAARSAMHKSMEALIPAGYMENHRAARREMLLGFRKLLDAAIEHIDKKQQG
jgi:ribosomal protein S19E (S16A)